MSRFKRSFKPDELAPFIYRRTKRTRKSNGSHELDVVDKFEGTPFQIAETSDGMFGIQVWYPATQRYGSYIDPRTGKHTFQKNLVEVRRHVRELIARLPASHE